MGGIKGRTKSLKQTQPHTPISAHLVLRTYQEPKKMEFKCKWKQEDKGEKKKKMILLCCFMKSFAHIFVVFLCFQMEMSFMFLCRSGR